MIVGWRRRLSLPPTQSLLVLLPLLSNSLHFTWTFRGMGSWAQNGLEVDATDDKQSSSSIPLSFFFFESSSPLWLVKKWQMLMRDKLWDHKRGGDAHTHSHACTHFVATREETDLHTDTHKATFIIILPISASNFRAALLLLSGFLYRTIKAVYWQFSLQGYGLF